MRQTRTSGSVEASEAIPRGDPTCLNIGGLATEQAVANAFLEAVTPTAVQATLLTVQELQANHGLTRIAESVGIHSAHLRRPLPSGSMRRPETLRLPD
jgi:DNA-binding phage protein